MTHKLRRIKKGSTIYWQGGDINGNVLLASKRPIRQHSLSFCMIKITIAEMLVKKNRITILPLNRGKMRSRRN
jgi:hypothetical protein